MNIRFSSSRIRASFDNAVSAIACGGYSLDQSCKRVVPDPTRRLNPTPANGPALSVEACRRAAIARPAHAPSWSCSLERSAGSKDTQNMSVKEKKRTTKIPVDLSSHEAVKRFREAAAEFTKEGTRSRESAMKVLVESGIYTESGKLSKNYRT